MFTPDRLSRFWRPPAYAIAGVAAVLREHWRAATGMRPARLFWQTSRRWLEAPATTPATTSPAEAGSSDTPQGPHQC